MCRTQYVLALLVLYMGLAHSFSWDIVAVSGSQLKFYFKGRHSRTEYVASDSIELITYDAVGNRIFFADRVNEITTIFSYDISSEKVESVVLKEIGVLQAIVGIAFDPVEELLFWGDWRSNMYWFSLKPGFENNVYGNLLIHLTDRQESYLLTPAVDSCRGYIYWTSKEKNANNLPSTIERARFDGSDREVLIDSNIKMPCNLVIDQQSQKMYWTDGIWANDDVGRQFFLESADLKGKNRTVLYNETGIYQPTSFALSNDSFYWLQWPQGTIYQFSKNPSINEKPKAIISMRASDVFEIDTNFKIDDQIRGIQDCKRLKRLLPNNSVTDDNVSSNVSSDVNLFCVHGKKVSGTSQCQCTHGYSGERCDVSVCHNYCFQGDCIVSDEEQATCRCHAGYSGERCQVNDCQGYCLNDGICSLDEESQAVCQCKEHYEGKRCDVSTCQNKCFQQVVSMVPIPCPPPS